MESSTDNKTDTESKDNDLNPRDALLRKIDLHFERFSSFGKLDYKEWFLKLAFGVYANSDSTLDKSRYRFREHDG